MHKLSVAVRAVTKERMQDVSRACLNLCTQRNKGILTSYMPVAIPMQIDNLVIAYEHLCTHLRDTTDMYAIAL